MTTEKKPLTDQQLENIADEHTVFGLAVLAVDLHNATIMRNKAQVANSFFKIGIMLRNNKGFIERFKKAQDAVKAAMVPKDMEPQIRTLIDNPKGIV